MEKEKSNITVGYYHALEDKQITIPLEEYKELLIIKGKYEELQLLSLAEMVTTV